jgi:hypothetical protein
MGVVEKGAISWYKGGVMRDYERKSAKYGLGGTVGGKLMAGKQWKFHRCRLRTEIHECFDFLSNYVINSLIYLLFL